MWLKPGEIIEAQLRISFHTDSPSNVNEKLSKDRGDLMRTNRVLHLKVKKSADISISYELYAAITL